LCRRVPFLWRGLRVFSLPTPLVACFLWTKFFLLGTPDGSRFLWPPVLFLCLPPFRFGTALGSCCADSFFLFQTCTRAFVLPRTPLPTFCVIFFFRSFFLRPPAGVSLSPFTPRTFKRPSVQCTSPPSCVCLPCLPPATPRTVSAPQFLRVLFGPSNVSRLRLFPLPRGSRLLFSFGPNRLRGLLYSVPFSSPPIPVPFQQVFKDPAGCSTISTFKGCAPFFFPLCFHVRFCWFCGFSPSFSPLRLLL